jgi:hypothetical protein
MGNRRIDDLLKGFLGLNLLVEDPKSHIFKVHYEGIFTIVLDLFLEDAEHELLFVLLLVGRKIYIGIVTSFSVGALE